MTRTCALLVAGFVAGCCASLASAAAVAVVSGVIVTGSRAVTHATCTITPAAADTFVDERNPTTPNGAATTVSVSPNANKRTRVEIRFELGSCPSSLSGALVDSAVLTLTATAVPNVPRTLTVRRLTAAWSPATATWNTQPAFAGTATTTLAVGTSPGAKSFDVTNDVDDVVQSARVPTPPPYAAAVPDFGWVIADEGASANVSVVFASSEHGTAASRPRLVVAYAY